MESARYRIMTDFYIVYCPSGFATYNENKGGLDYTSIPEDAAVFSTAREALKVARRLKGAVCACDDGQTVNVRLLTLAEVQSHIIDETGY